MDSFLNDPEKPLSSEDMSPVTHRVLCPPWVASLSWVLWAILGLVPASQSIWHSKSFPAASLHLGLAALRTIWSPGTAAHRPCPQVQVAPLTHSFVRPAVSLMGRTPYPAEPGQDQP